MRLLAQKAAEYAANLRQNVAAIVLDIFERHADAPGREEISGILDGYIVNLLETGDFRGVVDLVAMKAYVWENEQDGTKFETVDIPDDMMDLAKSAHDRLFEAVAETDEVLTEKFLEGKEITEAELWAAARRATIGFKLVPVFCGSAFKNKGVQPLLDAVVALLPSPLDMPDVIGLSADDNEEQITRQRTPEEPFSGIVFKIVSDPFVGSVCYVRIYSGVLKSG